MVCCEQANRTSPSHQRRSPIFFPHYRGAIRKVNLDEVLVKGLEIPARRRDIILECKVVGRIAYTPHFEATLQT